jgi:hypothetical protein
MSAIACWMKPGASAETADLEMDDNEEELNEPEEFEYGMARVREWNNQVNGA